ncbi:uncharacterized protein V6R79_001986 [Siganus canaliculatus]
MNQENVFISGFLPVKKENNNPFFLLFLSDVKTWFFLFGAILSLATRGSEHQTLIPDLHYLVVMSGLSSRQDTDSKLLLLSADVSHTLLHIRPFTPERRGNLLSRHEPRK